MQILEKDLEIYTVRIARKMFGMEALKLNNFASAGWPDRAFLMGTGGVFFIEFKTLLGRLHKLQCIKVRQLVNMRFNVYIVNSREEALNVVQYEGENKVGSTPLSKARCGNYDLTKCCRATNGSRVGEN